MTTEFEGIIVMCLTCQGTGTTPEDHGQGNVEYLACPDCRGVPVIEEKLWRYWIKTLRSAGFTIAHPSEPLACPLCGEVHPRRTRETSMRVSDQSMKPTIGRIVIYKSKIDNGPGNDVLSPAMIIRTKDTTVLEVAERWGPAPQVVGEGPNIHQVMPRPDSFQTELPDDTTVDLVVFGLGRDYREYAVEQGDERGQWSWPLKEL